MQTDGQRRHSGPVSGNINITRTSTDNFLCDALTVLSGQRWSLWAKCRRLITDSTTAVQINSTVSKLMCVESLAAFFAFCSLVLTSTATVLMISKWAKYDSFLLLLLLLYAYKSRLLSGVPLCWNAAFQTVLWTWCPHLTESICNECLSGRCHAATQSTTISPLSSFPHFLQSLHSSLRHSTLFFSFSSFCSKLLLQCGSLVWTFYELWTIAIFTFF